MARKTRAQKQLEHGLDVIEQVRQMGYYVPDLADKFVKEKLYAEKGVDTVRRCSCGETLEFYTKVKSVTCRKGHEMRVVWQATQKVS